MNTTFNNLPTTIFGLKNENSFFKYIKSIYPDTINNNDKNNKSRIDFLIESITNLTEFKSRKDNIKHDRWDTAIINCCKVDYWYDNFMNRGYSFFIYYLYSDGLFRVKVDKKLRKQILPSKRWLKSFQEAKRGGKCLVYDIPHENMEFVLSVENYKNIINQEECEECDGYDTETGEPWWRCLP